MHDSRNRKAAAWALAAVLIGIGAWQAVEAPHESPHASRKHREKDEDVDVAKEIGKVYSGITPENASALRIEQLEAELLEARKPKAFDLKEQISDWSEDVGLGLSWAIAYFTLFPTWWNGQTPGKRLFGLRVVELTGKPITVLRAFKRYGGYAAGMATGAFGFAQVFWDPNRQAIQDKTAHTVVIDLRRKLRPLAPATEKETP
jgi:RDD family